MGVISNRSGQDGPTTLGRLRAFLNAIPESLVIVNNAGVIIEYNRAWEQFGRANGASTHVDWRGVNYLEVCREADGPEKADADQALAGVLAVLEGRQPEFTMEYPCHSPDAERWFLMQVLPIPDADGGVAISHLDITARVKNETSARLSRLILDNSAEAVVVTGLDERIQYVNQAFTDITGYTAEEAIGNTPRLLASGRHDAAFYGAMWESLKTRHRWQGEIWNRRKCGEIYPELVHINAVSVTGSEATHFVALFSDISTMKAKEARLRAINMELEQFASVVSHDLRQPLRSVTSYLQLLKRRMGGTLAADPEATEYLGFAVQAATRMNDLITDMLSYARAGQVDPEAGVSPRPLGPVVWRVVEGLSPRLAEVGARVDVAPDLPAVVVPPTDLDRLFENLIGNAVKYRDPDRPLVVTVDAGPPPDGAPTLVQLRVCDTGIGIAPEDRDRVFAMFTRAERAQSYASGTGIGLAICKKIVERHGGTIRIIDHPDGCPGSCFSFTLPLLASGCGETDNADERAREAQPPGPSRVS